MSNWFETIVPDDHTWSDISRTNEKISSKDALDIVEYLNSVLSDPMNPKFDNDNFTAIVNIRNGFIPINGDYTGFSIEIQGEIAGEQVNKTVLHTDDPSAEVWIWSVKSISFIKDGAPRGESNPVTIDAGDDYVMRIKVEGSDQEPGKEPYDKRGPYWAEHAEFNPKITPAALASIKAALNREQGTSLL
nr:MAG TPA: hypothetical protein [Caudoviricetes sp.]